MTRTRRDILIQTIGAAAAAATPTFAFGRDRPGQFSSNEIIDNGHRFFGSVSRGLAQGIEKATKRWGRPNAYILGQEGSGAFIGGLRYGEGQMYTRNAGDRKVYWQGPSIGFDVGADGDLESPLIRLFAACRRRGRCGRSVRGDALPARRPRGMVARFRSAGTLPF